MAQIKRETAIICAVNDLLQGSFVRTEGWAPSYFSTEAGNISRANLMGVVVNKETEGIVIDDGSGRILLRSFDTALPETEIGDLMLIIGRPRIFNEKKYVVPEIMKKIDPKWAEYRKLQLERIPRATMPAPVEKREIITETQKGQNPYQRIVEFIKDLDTGEGADIGEVERRSGAPNAGELISRLIEEGEIFEIKPGRIKILE
jgi:hypothetical protein